MTYDLILVPQGAEAAAVRRGVKLARASIPILTIAMGPEETTQRLQDALDQEEFKPHQRILVLGVAGSLAPQFQVGDIVVYQELAGPTRNSASSPNSVQPDRFQFSLDVTFDLDTALERLPQAQVVTALNCDRLVHLAAEKRVLHRQTGADVVDMEALAIAQALGAAQLELHCTTVRVISDNAEQDLPNLEQAQRAGGGFDAVAMAGVMSRQPRAAFRLIRGSLRALKVLEQVSFELTKTLS